MMTVILKDNQTRQLSPNGTAADLAASISPRLAKEAFIARVDGALVDLATPLSEGCRVEILTRDHPDVLETLRHDTAHLVAQAVKELYGDKVQVTIGPAIDNGFYYDFARDEPFTPDDLTRIENKMKELVDRGDTITREEWDRDEAVAFFEKSGEKYKAEIIRSIPAGEKITLYRQGNFIDLCRGPHGPSTRLVGKAFKLLKLAGAYWRGDSTQPMLQRIYGTVWPTEKELNEYLHNLAEAEKRDHRKLGREMELFHLQEEAVGSVFWHPKGWALYRKLQSYIQHKLERAGYVEVNTPILLDKSLWEQSGHWEKFRENMFVTHEVDDKSLAMKPMSCPGHIQIFKQGIKSYRDLPLRMAEFGRCHRNEPSGALHGIMRVRSFVQDDAHIFCTEDQILDESRRFFALLDEVYRDLGFPEYKVRLSDRPPVRAGTDAAWDHAEEILQRVMKETNVPYEPNPGEGAFYGPKLEFILKDALGREWQCGTLQVDFILPERLGSTYIGEDGQKHRPVMLHRAILGTFERFIGILIEHYGGKFPVWLAPLPVVIAPITSAANDYALSIKKELEAVGIKVDVDCRNEKINYKIREHSLAKIPYIWVVGDREAANKTVTVRTLGKESQETLELSRAIDTLGKEVAGPMGGSSALTHSKENEQ